MKEKSLVKSEKNDISYGPEELKDLIIFDAVSKYKSVVRAIRRGDVTKYGTITPKDPSIIGQIALEELVLIAEQ